MEVDSFFGLFFFSFFYEVLLIYLSLLLLEVEIPNAEEANDTKV